MRASATYLYTLTPEVFLSAGPELNMRYYFGYFTDRFDTERRDIGAAVRASARWSPNDYVTVQGGLSFGYNQSTINVLDHRVFTVSPSVTAQIRF